MRNPEIHKNFTHNATVHIMDGAFFGMGMGFASTVTIIPLFVNTLTDSTTLIGLIASIHLVGWQLPQILTANYVANLQRYLRMVLLMSLHERWPFLGLAVVALAVPVLGPVPALILTFVLLTWQALGGGFTATAWQTLIGKIIPLRRRGTFWGLQAAASAVLMAGSAYIAGRILVSLEYPYNFALCFFLAAVAMAISWAFLALTREKAHTLDPAQTEPRRLRWPHLLALVRNDANFRGLLIARSLSQFAWMSVAFYTVYGVRHFGMDEATAGVMVAMLTLVQTVAQPLMGWLGDQWGHRRIFGLGMLALAGSALAASVGPTLDWLYVAFILAGIGFTVIWTTSMTFTLEFGSEADRPYYVGLANTLIAPATLSAPLLGGLLADAVGFGATFGLAAVSGVITAAILFFVVRDPIPLRQRAAAIAGD
jgi:MFS family permease